MDESTGYSFYYITEKSGFKNRKYVYIIISYDLVMKISNLTR